MAMSAAKDFSVPLVRISGDGLVEALVVGGREGIGRVEELREESNPLHAKSPPTSEQANGRGNSVSPRRESEAVVAGRKVASNPVPARRTAHLANRVA